MPTHQITRPAPARGSAFVEPAKMFVLRKLRSQFEMTGEEPVNLAKEAGHIPYDDRAFGTVFKQLVKEKLIFCVGFTIRAKGHKTGGARRWRASK